MVRAMQQVSSGPAGQQSGNLAIQAGSGKVARIVVYSYTYGQANFGQSALNCPFKWGRLSRLSRLTRCELLPSDQLTAINLLAFTPLHSDSQNGQRFMRPRHNCKGVSIDAETFQSPSISVCLGGGNDAVALASCYIFHFHVT